MRRWPVVAGIVVLCIALLAWQWPTLVRLAIITGAQTIANVYVTFGNARIGLRGAVFEDVHVTSRRNEPIATISRLNLTYNLRDFLGGRRLFGLKSIDLDEPAVTIVRRSDGTFNVPFPQLHPTAAHAAPLIVRASIRNGSILIVNQSAAALPNQRRLYARDVQADADLSTAARSTYSVALKYGEQPNRLYPVSGRGIIDKLHDYVDQHWTAAQLPVASAISFAVNSDALHVRSGMLRNVDARYFGGRIGSAMLRPHFAASAYFNGGRMTMAGLEHDITAVAGPVDVYDDGVLTPGLTAQLAGIPARITGGLYGLNDPRLRVSVQGSGNLAQLRTVVPQGRRLLISGPLLFALLIEGRPSAPMTWIALRSPRTTYAGTTLEDLDGVAAYDGQQADIFRFGAAYDLVTLSARGRVSLHPQPNAIEMLVRAHSPPGGAPYVKDLLPKAPLDAAVLATARDPHAIAARGAIWGSGEGQSLAANFNIDDRGNGAVGPLEARSGTGSLYARIALRRNGAPTVGVADVRDLPLPGAHGTIDADFVGSRTGNTIGVAGEARLGTPLGPATMDARVAMRGNTLRGGVLGDLGSEGSFGATVGGDLISPQVAGTVVVAGGRYRDFNVDGNAGLAYANGTLDVHDAAVAIGPLFIGVAGTVRGVLPNGTFAPQYDLAAQVHTSDASALVATVSPKNAPLVQGSVDANLHVRGVGTTPSFAGRVSAPEGSVNGLSFRDFAGGVSGNTSAVSVSGGRVIVGSSPIALSATATRAGSAAVDLNAPRLDLSDFNDFFDTGDTFAGTGSLALRAQTAGGRLLASSGAASFSNARFRRLDLGTVAANWNSSGSSIATSLHVGGPTGDLTLNGTIAPATRSVDLQASAQRVDLSTWLPMLGYNVPVTGQLNATTVLAGAFPDLSMRAHAAVFGGTVDRMNVERFEVSVSAVRGRGTIQSATFDVPWLSTVASGTFGLHPNDPLAIVATSTSTNVGEFLKTATDKDFGVSGSMTTTLRVEGTRNSPRLGAAIALQQLRYHNLTIPRVQADIAADRHRVAIRSGEIDLTNGRALLAGEMPIALTGTRVTPVGGSISGSLTAENIQLSNFVDLLPKGTQLSGRIDGRVEARGTVQSPDLNGALTLADGAFNGPMERSPITGLSGTLTLSGTRAQLQSRALVGGGDLTASGVVSLADLRRPADATFTINGSVANARLDLPAYFQGNLNGSVAVERTLGALPSVSGDITISKARLPLNAFLSLNRGGGTPTQLPNVAFHNLNVSAANDVRIQSANVDIGTTGAVRLGGTLESPTLDGAFRSTGGSLTFYRSFNIERGDVTFDPSGGLIPRVNAVATTFVANPATAVRLHVTGLVTDMDLALASDPPYSKEQILGLLIGAQQFGAVQGVASTGGSPFSATAAARTLALGQLNTAFTRTLLEPLSTSVGSAFGFTEVQITSDLQTGLGVNAVKAFGKYLTFIFRQTFGYPQTQSITAELNPNETIAYRLTGYTSVGPTLFALQQPVQPAAASVLNINPASSFIPNSSSNGVNFSLVRKY